MQLSDMVGRVSERLAEGAIGPTFYPRSAIVAGLNEGLRFFVLLTLGLEQIAEWTVPPATTFFHMLDELPDWICPLRITTASGAKVRPARLQELTMLDSAWIASPAPADTPPARYSCNGVDLVGLYKQPSTPGVVLNVTYARSPLPLISDADVPEVPPEYHAGLVDYAIPCVREAEGGGEFEKSLPYLGKFLDGAQRYGDYVRGRNQGSLYDRVPFELARFDRSRLLKMRRDLMSGRRPAEG